MFKRQLNLPGNTPTPGRNYIHIYYIIYIYIIYIYIYIYILLYIYIYIQYILSGLDHPRNPTWNFPLPPFPTGHLHLPNFRHPGARLPARLPTRQPWCQQEKYGGFGLGEKLGIQLKNHQKGIREEYHGICQQQYDDWGYLGSQKAWGLGFYMIKNHPKLIVSRFHQGITML